MKLYIDGTLNIEVTQFCNLNCDHCLKGTSRTNKITKSVIEKIFKDIKYADTIFFSGGEVTLAYDEIKMVIDYIKENDIKVNKYQIITNGTNYNKKLFDLLRSSFKSGQIFLSVDYFHDKSIREKCDIKKVLKNYRKIIFERDFDSIGHLPNYLYNCGNAVNLEDIVKTNTPTFGFITIPFRINKERYLRVGPTLSFDVFGNITGSVGTYQVNDNNHYGNIFNDDLRSLLINNSIYVLKDFRRYREELDKRVSEYFDDDLLEKEFEYFIEDKKLVKKKVEKIENEVNKEYYNDNNLIFYQNHMEEVVYEMCYTKGKDSKRRNR